MRQYDPNPGLSALTVVIGAVLGIALGVLLDVGTVGVLVLLVVGILAAGLLASATGLTRERGPRETDDLPSSYDDY